MKHTPGIAGKLFGTLGRNGINVIACAQGASETNISFVVDSKSLRKSLNVIHDSFFLSEYQVLNLFICGVGTVGGSLVEQIRQQQKKLMVENGLKLHVVGIIDATKAMFSRAGFDLANYREELKEKGVDSSLDTIRDEIIGMNIFNSVFVDCTASPDIASLYKDFLQHNISVVAANKIAASSAYENYRELKLIARQRGVKYLFETNVGAGLPIINTINDLIHSGDKILKIEAVLSGTLNYIFNKISADVPFSRTIKMAQEERYSEPDPRIDLSGKDVIRKLVIPRVRPDTSWNRKTWRKIFSYRMTSLKVRWKTSGKKCLVWMLISKLAARCSRVRINIGVSLPSWRTAKHPSVCRKWTATILLRTGRQQ